MNHKEHTIMYRVTILLDTLRNVLFCVQKSHVIYQIFLETVMCPFYMGKKLQRGCIEQRHLMSSLFVFRM